MNFINPIRVLQFHKNIIIPIQHAIQVNNYAVGGQLGKVKKSGKKGHVPEKQKMEVCDDVNRLINYCCGSNIFIEGEDVKLKPDSEYPDWLWTLYTGPTRTPDQLDPNTKKYWRTVRRIAIKQNLKLRKYK